MGLEPCSSRTCISIELVTPPLLIDDFLFRFMGFWPCMPCSSYDAQWEYGKVKGCGNLLHHEIQLLWGQSIVILYDFELFHKKHVKNKLCNLGIIPSLSYNGYNEIRLYFFYLHSQQYSHQTQIKIILLSS